MSELEDLGDIADQCALGGGLAPTIRQKKPFSARCGSPDHMKPGFIRISPLSPYP